MAKFVFGLESVLKQRRAVERDRLLVVAEIERERNACEDMIRSLRAQIEEERGDLARLLHDERGGERPVDLGLVRMQASASLTLTARAQREVFRLSGIHARLDRARAELLDAAIKRRAIETLRDAQFEEWLAIGKRAEAAALDEIAVMRGARAGEVAT